MIQIKDLACYLYQAPWGSSNYAHKQSVICVCVCVCLEGRTKGQNETRTGFMNVEQQ